MQIGVCVDIQRVALAAQAGFDFVELDIREVTRPHAPDAEFEKQLRVLDGLDLPATVGFGMMPPDMKAVGPNIDAIKLFAYAHLLLERAAKAGIKRLCFASPQSRLIPEDFPREKAMEQMVTFGKMLGALADSHDMQIYVEPVDSSESNCINNLAEGIEFIKLVNHSKIRLVVNSYHWLNSGEKTTSLIRGGPFIRHVHIATGVNRLPPGQEEERQFESFFATLKKVDYAGDFSLLCRWTDFAAQGRNAMRATLDLLREAGFASSQVA